jgi:hypothetical protein
MGAANLWLIALPLPDRDRIVDLAEADRQRFALYSSLHDFMVGGPGASASSSSSAYSRQLQCVLTPLDLPPFRTGTLDSLVKASEELASGEQRVLGVLQRYIANAAQMLHVIPGTMAENSITSRVKDPANLSGILMIQGDKTPESYARSFTWNGVKYRHDLSIAEILSGFLFVLHVLLA